MRDEIEHFKRTRKKFGSNEWAQEFLSVPTDDEHAYHSNQARYLGDERVEVVKPSRCQKLEAVLAVFGQGRQQHCCMTLVETVLHADDAIDVKDISLFIPYRVSPRHYLRVEDEERQLRPGHIYAFNQRREHKLHYQSEYGSWAGSKPCSALSVCFERKHPANPNRY
jgi:hypothetical protein